MCVYCNLQNTEKISHTTERGTCERCGEYYISKENQIIDENLRHEKALNDLYSDYSSQFDYLESRANYYYNNIDYQKSYVNSQCTYYSSQVSNLKTKLAIAKLDTSSAGKAKVREIEAQLSEAQSEYNYFIAQQQSWAQYDSYCNQLESLNSQYDSNKNKENKLHLDNLEKINNIDE